MKMLVKLYSNQVKWVCVCVVFMLNKQASLETALEYLERRKIKVFRVYIRKVISARTKRKAKDWTIFDIFHLKGSPDNIKTKINLLRWIHLSFSSLSRNYFEKPSFLPVWLNCLWHSFWIENCSFVQYCLSYLCW